MHPCPVVTYTATMMWPRLVSLTFITIPAWLSVNVAASQEAMQTEKQYEILFETTQHKQYCKATASLEYLQMNTHARYNGTIENEDCGVAEGSYTISVRFRDEDGHLQTIEEKRTWQSNNGQPHIFEDETYIGENVDLIRVRPRKVQCICVQSTAANDIPQEKKE